MDPVPAEDVIDPDYLPFTAQHLADHFAPVAVPGDPGDHLAYYLASAERARALAANPPTGTSAEIWKAIKWGRQMEKDERFWVAATLMRLFHAPNRVALLAETLRHCLGDTPPDSLPSWEAALGQEQLLYFEAGLPSPAAYRDQLAHQLDERILVPYLRKAAKQRGDKLEGPTKVDALLISRDTGFAVLFEAKVVSDISTGVQFDVLRNQIARTIDVMLDPNRQLQPPLSRRSPERTCYVLITPEIFRKNPESRPSTLEPLRRYNTMITTNYSCRSLLLPAGSRSRGRPRLRSPRAGRRTRVPISTAPSESHPLPVFSLYWMVTAPASGRPKSSSGPKSVSVPGPSTVQIRPE
jgi:hypothetical protein